LNEQLRTVSDLSKDLQLPSDYYDLLSKYLSQVRSTVKAINDDDQLEELTTPDLINILWLIKDRMEDMEKVIDRIMKLSPDFADISEFQRMSDTPK